MKRAAFGGAEALRLYQQTSRAAAHATLADGFRNAWGYYLTDRLWYGVWLADSPAAAAEVGNGDTFLTVQLDTPDAALAEYEWVGLTTLGRTYLVLADFINQRGWGRAVHGE